jgi:alpha-L-rhamnosidase
MRVKLTATAGIVGLVLAGMAVTATAASARTVSHSTAEAPSLLRVNGQASDAIVDSTRPTLSWAQNDFARAEAQTAYEIRVSDIPTDRGHQTGTLWDSGRISSAESSGVAYAGPALQADHTYEWTVRTWNSQGQQSPWAHAERFDAGPMGVQDWSASWLKVADGSLVRRSFTLPEAVVRARLYLGAQGLVEPHLNGAVIDPKQVLNSNVTDYAKRVVYRDYDVTDQLRPGPNALSVMVGKGQFSGSPTFIAQLSITFADGSHTTISTDGNWRTAPGPVTRDDFYYGESWDARKQVAGWDSATLDDSGWSTVPVYTSASQPTSLALGRPVTALDETACCGWSRAALVDGIDMSTDQSEGYHSAIETTADHTKWVQVDLGSDQQIAGITLFPARPTNDTAGDFPGAGFPVRYEVQVSDDPTFVTSTTVVDRTGSDQPNPGTTPVSFTTSVTGRYVRVTATKLQCRDTSCTFRLVELGVYGPHPAMTWGLTHLEADTTPPTRIAQTLAPKTTTTSTDGVMVYDFGQNYVGQTTLTASAPAGTKAVITKGELLDSNGRVTTTNISFSPSDTGRQIDDYTFDGSGTQTWTPNFNYAGFRYAEVTGLPAGAKVSIVADVIHSDVAQTGSFSTSNPLLNQIQSAVLQTQLNDLQGLPLDCPTREKHGWLGDAGDTDTEAMANLDMQSLYAKWLGDIRTSQNSDGSVPSVAPTNGGTGWFTDPAWGTAYPQIVWDSYTQYGDASVLRDNYSDVKGWVDYLATISDSNHIVTNSPGSWGDDWLATVSTPHVYFQTLFYLIDSRLLANMATALGNTADATKYTQLAQAIGAGFTAKYFDPATDMYAPNTQLAYAMPLALGIVPAGHEQAVLGKLIADIVAHEDHVTTGFVGTTFVYQALGLYHRNDVALAIAERTDYPSFGYMVTNGPGTIWEKWNNSSSPDGTSSKDHIGLAGSIGQWYYQQLAGIQPGTAGWRTFTLAPSVVGDLTHVASSQQTVRGTIASSWNLDGGTLTYKAEVPVGSTATIELPLLGGAGSTVRERGVVVYSGGHAIGADPGLTVRGVANGALTITAGSGSYVFTVKAPSTPVTNLAITSATTQAAIAPGATGDVSVAVQSSSTGGGNAVLGAQAPAGWTVTADPATIPLTAGPTHTLATLHVTPPADALGSYSIDLTVRAPDGTTAGARVTVDVYHRNTLFDFESGTQGWQAGANVDGVAAVSSMANGPGRPYDGAKALEAADTNADASQWHTISVTPAQPLDLSAATHVVLAMDSWGGLPGATYRAQVVLHSGSTDRTFTTPITNDTWNQIDFDISTWAQRADITSIDVSFSAVGSTAAWGGRFQIDDLGWTDQQV